MESSNPTMISGETNMAVIQTNISYIQKDISSINQNIKELSGVYATKIFVDDSYKSLDLRTKKLEESSNLWHWLSPTLGVVFGSVLTFLLISYISKL